MIIEWELNAGPKVGIIVNHNAMDKGTATVAAVDKRAADQHGGGDSATDRKAGDHLRP